ncbi:MAG: hypothetical protein NVSMB18_18740 [Acetobacteraceae bacterium]
MFQLDARFGFAQRIITTRGFAGTVSWLDRLAPVAAALIAIVAYVDAHERHPVLPNSVEGRTGWFTWYDAGKYLRAAIAWSKFDLRPSEHWYMPGYPILGTVGRAFTPVQPFFLPDAFCLAAATILFALLTAELLGRRPGAMAMGALVFLATSVLHPVALDVWVTPWTTTPATPVIYGCLLAAMRLEARPRALTAFVVGLAGGGILLFRPTESAFVLAAVAVFLGWSTVRRRLPWREVRWIAAAGCAGVALPIGAALAATLATGGFGAEAYLALSQRTGFEWRYLPLRFVEVFGDARPLWPGETGLMGVFPWVVPGFAGMALAPWCGGRVSRLRHGLLIGTTVVHCLIFAAYRDLHPNQLWFTYLYHYFKWVLPVLGLYAVLLPVYLVGRSRVSAIPVAVALVVALFGWRPELAATADAPPAIRLDGHSLELRQGLGSVWDAVVVPAEGTPDAISFGKQTFQSGSRVYSSPLDFRAVPLRGGLMLIAERQLHADDIVVSFASNVTLDAEYPPAVRQQRLVFGVPCWMASSRAVCQPDPLWPGAMIEPGRTLEFGAEAAIYRGAGWSRPETFGCWTEGSDASMGFRLPTPIDRDVVLELVGRGYAPKAESNSSRVAVFANGLRIADLRPPSDAGPIRIPIPKERFGPNGEVWLRFSFDDPRSPADNGNPNDPRRLGLLVLSMRVVVDGAR